MKLAQKYENVCHGLVWDAAVTSSYPWATAAPPDVGHSHAVAVFLVLNKPPPRLLWTCPLNLDAQEGRAFCCEGILGQVGRLCNQWLTQVSLCKLKMKRHFETF